MLIDYYYLYINPNKLVSQHNKVNNLSLLFEWFNLGNAYWKPIYFIFVLIFFSCSMWDPSCPPGIKPAPPALGVQSPNY